MTAVDVELWHPFTARSIGWPDETLLPVDHSRPHVAALAGLGRDRGLTATVAYLTDRLRPWTATQAGVTWRYWPRDLPRSRRSGQHRREHSLTGLAATAARPAGVTIVNVSGHGSPMARRLAAAVRLRGRPYVAMVGGLHATTDGPQRRYYADAAVVAVHSTSLRDRFVAEGMEPRRVAVVPLGVDTSAFTPAAPHDGPPVVLYVGRIEEWKGLHHLVAALGELADRHPDARLRIVGPPSDPRYAARLRAEADALGLGDRLEVLGPRRHAELPGVYAAADLLVLPSSGEGFGMVVPEAMACGLPVVALDEPGGPRDVVEDGRTGLLVRPDGMAAAIDALLSDRGRRTALGAAGRAAALERWSHAVTTAAFADLVDRAVSRGGRTAH